MRRCEQPGCDELYLARGCCERHYRALRRYGDPARHSWWWGKSAKDRFWAQTPEGDPDQCWIWTGATKGSAPYQYGTILVDSRPTGAHRFSYTLHVGEIPPGMEVCHSCDNTLCVNPAHLFLGTHSDNMRDMVRKGRADNSGQRNGRSKLTAAQVAYIRNQATGRYGEITSFAREFSVGTGMMSKILKHQTWK